MAVYEFKVKQGSSTRSWQNVWHVSCPNDTVAGAIAGLLGSFHKGLLLSLYQVFEVAYRVRGTRNAFYTLPINLPGERSLPDGAEPLPLFDTVLGLLAGQLGGRAGGKFLRGLLVTTDLLAGDGLSSAIITTVGGNLGSLLASIATAGGEVVEGRTDDPVVSSSVHNLVQMRQQHRKRRRRRTTTP